MIMIDDEMELGNMIFGNSRGEYPLERGIGFEEELYRLFEACNPKRDNSWREYGFDFDNDTFTIFPYYWGDCECGYDEAEYKWSEENHHRDNCYQIEFQKISHYERIKDHDYWLSKYIKPLFQKYNLPTDTENWWHGCVMVCTCDFEQRWQEFLSDHDHSKDCGLVKPNFLYKPTGFEIQWYKYPLRDSYTNQEITLPEFSKIIDACIASLHP